MNKKIFFLAFICLAFYNTYCQENSKPDHPSTFSFFLNQDNAFGFYPSVVGTFPINEKLSASFYSIFWTNASYGSPELGTDLWTEMGVGLSFSAFRGNMLMNPSIGFTHGKLLSGGADAVPFDGIVPNVVGLVFTGSFEAEIFASWYKAMRSEGPETSDYLLYWVYPGLILSEHFSFGAHYEGFALSRQTNGASEMLYHWLGAYAKFNINDTYTLRFSTGKNFTVGDYADGFYKVTMMAILL